MVHFILFLHVIGAVGMGFYLLLPFMTVKVSGLQATAQEGYAKVLHGGNRIAQILLIVQFLTGGYLISQADYQVVWMIIVIVLFLLIGALTGILGKRIKMFSSEAKAGGNSSTSLAKIKTFSTIIAISLLITLYLMVYPMYQ